NDQLVLGLARRLTARGKEFAVRRQGKYLAAAPGSDLQRLLTAGGIPEDHSLARAIRGDEALAIGAELNLRDEKAFAETRHAESADSSRRECVGIKSRMCRRGFFLLLLLRRRL